jgi:hypothetical protein
MIRGKDAQGVELKLNGSNWLETYFAKDATAMLIQDHSTPRTHQLDSRIHAKVHHHNDDNSLPDLVSDTRSTLATPMTTSSSPTRRQGRPSLPGMTLQETSEVDLVSLFEEISVRTPDSPSTSTFRSRP